MIDTVLLYRSPGIVPYENLARERFMLENLPQRTLIFYLWQNQNTVVIGRNQNAWKECRTALLEEGGVLARRLSGGGAVFHDLGNLCFTFIAPSEDYDVARQNAVLLEAVRALGVDAAVKGRNDIEAEGKKFSGHAYYHSKTASMHHGTFLVSADLNRAQRYLSPPQFKITAKGFDSVRSRIVNLAELSAKVTIDTLSESLVASVEKNYGQKSETLNESFFDKAYIENYAHEFASNEWIYGRSPDCDMEISTRFSWGFFEIHFDIVKGSMENISVFSDCLDVDFIDGLPSKLKGAQFVSSDALLDKINGLFPHNE